jgi:uncharacterized membrane protein YfcA|nr:sulfite exporter TauE/SafE family protein [Polynucleobacter asymbioticus]
MTAGKIHHSKGLVDWQVLRYLWLGSLPASIAMILLMHFGLISTNVHFLKTILAIAILVTAITLLIQNQFYKLGKFFRLNQAEGFKRWQPFLTILAGITLGALVTLTSIGAGAIGVVMLTYLYPLRLKPARLVATDIVHAIPLTLFAGVGHLLIGNIDFGLLGWLLCGSIPGVMIGANLSSKVPQKILRIAISALLLLTAINLLR